MCVLYSLNNSGRAECKIDTDLFKFFILNSCK